MLSNLLIGIEFRRLAEIVAQCRWRVIVGPLFCLLVLAAWVRSYLAFDQVMHRVGPNHYAAVTSAQQRLFIGMSNNPRFRTDFGDGWVYRSFRWRDVAATLRSNTAYYPATVISASANGFPEYEFNIWKSREGQTNLRWFFPTGC